MFQSAQLISTNESAANINLRGQQSNEDLRYQQTIKNNAIAYERGKDAIDKVNPLVITELKQHITNQFNELPYSVLFVGRDVTCGEMNEYFAANKVLLISTLNNNSPLFGEDINLKFRAVHDYLHIICNFACDYLGEYQTFIAQSKGLSYAATQIMFSEIVLQASFFIYFGKFAVNQKVVLVNLA